MSKVQKGIIWFVGFVATVIIANWAVAEFGVIPVGFGLQAPAAVLVVGVAFTLRDLLQDTLGVRAVVAAIIIGAALSGLVATRDLAVASGVAFLFSEAADLAVYTPLRKRNWLGAVAASNLVGLFVDSFLFLWLATSLGPNRLDFLPGQILGKAAMTALALVILAPRRVRRAAAA